MAVGEFGAGVTGGEFDGRYLIARSMTYLGLALAIATLYAAIVLGAMAGLGRPLDEGPGLVFPIVAAAVVAVAFEPLRAWVQRLVNRLLYGERATPLDVLSRLTSRLSESPVQGIDQLAQLVADGSGADRATVWVLVDNTLHAHNSWPSEATEVEPVALAEIAERSGQVIELIRHGDEILGALSITKTERGTVSAVDRQLIADVAAGSGQLLRNLGLNAQLEERARQVRSSRKRLVATQDAERHRLERDLHDGAQQHVVALKVKLDVAKAMATRDQHQRLAERLDRLSTDTQEAVEALRTIAHGMYPAILETDGLGPALRSLTGHEALDLRLTIEELDRLPRRTEETLYFATRELIDATELAKGHRLAVLARTQADRTELRVHADVIIDEQVVTALADRVEAADGSLDVTASADGHRIAMVFGPDIEADFTMASHGNEAPA